MTRPRLVTGARLRYDDVREQHVLLVPEGAVRLNPTAAEVLELCDGERSLDEIVVVLTDRYEGADLGDDVREEHVLLVPEGAVRLNPTAVEVLELCDGERSLDEIVVVLTERYDGADLGDDVRGLVDGMEQKGLVIDAAT